MKYSTWATKILTESGITALMMDLSTTDKSINMLGGGNPATIPQVEEYFREQMESILATPGQFEHLISNYAGPQGSRKFIAALANLLKSNYGWDIGPEHIAITNGSQMAFSLLFRLLAGAYPDSTAKRILLPISPEYIGYSDTGEPHPLFASRRPKINILSEHIFKYQIDFEHLEPSDDISAICVTRPTNPTGNMLTDGEIKSLATIARHHQIPLIVDGAYGLPFPNIVFREETKPYWDENVILTLSLSKLGLPGCRTGIVIADPAIIDALSCVNAVTALASCNFGATLALESVRSNTILKLGREVILPYYRQAAMRVTKFIEHYFEQVPYMLHSIEGAFFVWLWFPDLPIGSAELYRRIKDSGTIIVPGHHFFPGLEDRSWRHRYECIRVSFAAKPETVEAGVKTIASEVARAYSENQARASSFG